MLQLRAMREKKGLTQFKLSEASGIPQQTISAIESGVRKNPGIETLLPIAKVLGCSIDELISDKAENEAAS